ncbi:hypothetical protein GCM10009718_16350 [Isoptericola halotolerans]|uniref:D-alanyl-D-alanine carboxypeptidase-like core domain-containing protein n=1 Tax=Isoptericola halotolerans TaxID=300560 RepID=A0ABX2AA70_9MICO|nr:M15 family metallopeptidase [Isoptericola halotolerans]NOV98791.1 hypothetical protein [Isoptericola halotolerans]
MKHARDTAAPAPSRRTRQATRGRHFAEKPRRRSTAGPRVTLSVTAAAALVLTTGGTYLAEAEPAGTTTDADTTTRTVSSAAVRAAVPDRPAVEDPPAVTVDRSLGVSRSDERLPRTDRAIQPAPEAPENPPGCDVEVTTGWSNGRIPRDQLCAPWPGTVLVRADVARSLAELNELYTARFGEPMCLTDGYRSYELQVATKAAKGYLAATPGTSNHGWGLAVDLCPETYAGDRWAWLDANAPALGWVNPAWARPGGSKYEPWHWESTEV